MVRRERAAAPPGRPVLCSITAQGAISFAGGSSRASRMFDVGMVRS